MDNNHFRKCYNSSQLLGSKEHINGRIKFINFYTPLISSLAGTSIKRLNNNYYYKQSLIKKKPFKHIGKSILFDKLKILAKHLNKISNLGFVHGDLNMKNIIFDGESFIVVDFEPSLFQKKNGIKKIMMTPPYWSYNDIQNKDITFESDKIGFYCICLRIFDNNFFIKDRIKITLKRRNNFIEFLPIPEKKLIDMQYEDLLLHAKTVTSI